ncbi:MAG: DNA repair protein RadA [Pyrinomonadaceae bacterium]|nr:DNA repair protein RadA [Pyrinomonadaceae bacterium]
MAKQPATIYVCSNCGGQQRKWLGRCPDCGEFNTLTEEKFRPSPQTTGKAVSANARLGADAFRVVKPMAYSEIESQDDARTSSGIDEFDRVLGGGIVAGSLVLIGGSPGIGKCLSGSTRVFDAKTGDFLPIIEWKNAGRNVLSLDEKTYKFSLEKATAFHDQGRRKVFEIETKLGRKIRCTANHPFLTVAGWKPLSELKSGDYLAAPRALPFFGESEMPESEIKLIAYLLSDGSPQNSITITATLSEVEKDIYDIADYFDLKVRVYQKANSSAKDFRLTVPKCEKVVARRAFARNFVKVRNEKNISWAQIARQIGEKYETVGTWRNGNGVPSKNQFAKLTNVFEIDGNALNLQDRDQADTLNRALHFIESVGLRFKTAVNKSVPDCIFRLPKVQLSTFLKILFSCDGSVYVNAHGQAGISYSTISRRLAEDVQHLLLRFGFVAKLRTKKSRVNENPYTAYEIQLLGVENIKRFLSEIGIYGREKAKEKIARLPLPNLSSTHRDTIPTGELFWKKLKELCGNDSFKTVSEKAGISLQNRRHERPLCRSTIKSLANIYPNSFLENLAFSDVYWDEIKNINSVGEENVYDISVSAHENFVANDLIVHNSTIVIQMADKLSSSGGNVLYVSGEESERQIKMRGERLGINAENLFLLPETNLENILAEIDRLKPEYVIVDSIQTVFSEKIESAPGSVSQVREVAGALMIFAKQTSTPVFLIGHVTKEGSIAGPKALEHIVDTVLYFEGDRHHNHRIIRATKNRFGAANEIGIFEMTGEGLKAVGNPSEVFLQERPEGASGSVVTVCMEGTRPMLVEVQALVTGTKFGTGRRMAQGFDYNRTSLLIAVLEKRLEFQLAGDDVFINVAGGLEIDEPAADLGVIAAIASSFRNLQIPPDTAVFGEVGLTGEVRGVLQAETRAREAQTLGFKKLILPASNKKGLEKLLGMRVVGVRTLEEALDELF